MRQRPPFASLRPLHKKLLNSDFINAQGGDVAPLFFAMYDYTMCRAGVVNGIRI
jgi:hypothetical protein